MKYIKEFYSNFNYQRIAKTMKDYYKWNSISMEDIESFENNLGEIPKDEDEYTLKFNDWLFHKYKQARQIYPDSVDLRQRSGWYAKST